MENTSEVIKIRVNVADRYYPLKINAKDETAIRNAGKMINDRVLQYKKLYSDKDAQDFLAMAAIQFVTQLIQLEKRVDDSDVPDRILALCKKIDDILIEQQE